MPFRITGFLLFSERKPAGRAIPSFDARFRVDSSRTIDTAEDSVQVQGPVARLLRYWFESNGIQLPPRRRIPLSQGRSGHANRSQGRTTEEGHDRGVAPGKVQLLPRQGQASDEDWFGRSTRDQEEG